MTQLLAQPTDLAAGVSATVVYYLLALVVLILGFVIQDLLTPGSLRELVFIDHLPNAAIIAGAQAMALGTVLVTAIATAESDLLDGLIHVAVYSLLGLLLQTLAMVLAEMLIPGRFRDLVEDPKMRSSAMVMGVVLMVIGTINAVCLT